MRRNNRNITHRTSRSAVIILTVAASSAALAALPGLPPPAAPTQETVRPTEKTQRPTVVTTGDAIRGSLFEQGATVPVMVGPDGQQISGPSVSFTAVTPPKPKKYQKNDIVTVIVAVNASNATTSQSDSEKKQNFDVALQQFLQLATSASGLPTVGVVGQPSKLPEVKFSADNKRNNTADQARSDTVNDRFAAVVVDVKPNGTLVLEAVQQVAMDREVLKYKMSGICRAADITADNTILSTQLANLNLSKQTSGDVHNGVKQGWLNSIIDKINPF